MDELGVTFAAALLEAVQESITAMDLEMPAVILQAAGVGIPTEDPCDGLLWARVASVFPTDGQAQFTQARIDWGIPAWCFPIELGVLWCHPVIDEDGASPDAKVWSAMAWRDGQYRAALLDAVAYRYPDKVRSCANGQRLDPWAPIGPDGGYSGGLLVTYTMANFLTT